MPEQNPAITVAASSEVLPGTFPGDLPSSCSRSAGAACADACASIRRHLHPGGYVHGGAWVALADTVAAWGTMRNLPADRGFTTVELKINVLGAGRLGDELVGVGELLHAGRADAGVGGARLPRRGGRRRRRRRPRALRGELPLHPDDPVSGAFAR